MWQPGEYQMPPVYDPQDVKRRLDAGEIEVLDVRDPEEWDSGHIPGAHWIPLGDLDLRIDELDFGKEWICVCHIGERSAQAADLLVQEGIKAGNLRGGMDNWERLGLPMETGRGTPRP